MTGTEQLIADQSDLEAFARWVLSTLAAARQTAVAQLQLTEAAVGQLGVGPTAEALPCYMLTSVLLVFVGYQAVKDE